MADNPPAYPSVCLNDPNHPASIPGMSLLDYFAGQAAAGLSAYSGSYGLNNGPDILAGRAYEIAEAMLAEREKRGLK